MVNVDDNLTTMILLLTVSNLGRDYSLSENEDYSKILYRALAKALIVAIKCPNASLKLAKETGLILSNILETFEYPMSLEEIKEYSQISQLMSLEFASRFKEDEPQR
jgi:hypothetical protein